LEEIDLEDGGQLLDDLQPNIGQGPLDPAEVSPVYPRVVGQLLLRQLSPVPDAPEVRRKKLAQIHVPSQPTCGLLANGFKASNGGGNLHAE
jgi:hypothetical protein